MKKLDEHINKTIVLPIIGMPKELEASKDDIRFTQEILLTPQRIDIMKRFYKEAIVPKQHPRIGNGLILSGPNGQGKSILSYLLACTAYANDCVLVYIVRCIFDAC